MSYTSKPIHLISELRELNTSIKNKRILDVGCGKGDWISFLNRTGLRTRALVGLDVSPKEVTVAKSRNSARNAGFLRATIEKLPFKKNSFDIIICNVVLPYVDQKKAIEELSRVLDEDGVIFVSHHGFGWYLASALSGSLPWISLAIAFLIFLLGDNFSTYIKNIACQLDYMHTCMQYTSFGSMQTVSNFQKNMIGFGLRVLIRKVEKFLCFSGIFYMLLRRDIDVSS